MVFSFIAWNDVRNDGNSNIDWVLASYAEGSKTDITVLTTGNGGIGQCLAGLPSNKPIFGGFKHSKGRFLSFFHTGDGVSVLKRGKASMHKNGKCPSCKWRIAAFVHAYCDHLIVVTIHVVVSESYFVSLHTKECSRPTLGAMERFRWSLAWQREISFCRTPKQVDRLKSLRKESPPFPRISHCQILSFPSLWIQQR